MAKILIVDDSFVMRKNIKLMLEKVGHVVVAEVEDGANAYDAYVKYLPDLVTMDLEMPKVGGLEATERIIRQFPDAKIIVISGLSNKANITKAVRMGAYHFILKPISEEKVTSVVNVALTMKIDITKRLELVEKINSNQNIPADGNEGPLKGKEKSYRLDNINSTCVLIIIERNLNQEDMRAMATEIGVMLSAKRDKYLLEFAKGILMSEDALGWINQLTTRIGIRGGVVRAVCRDSQFYNFVKDRSDAGISSLAQVLRLSTLG